MRHLGVRPKFPQEVLAPEQHNTPFATRSGALEPLVAFTLAFEGLQPTTAAADQDNEVRLRCTHYNRESALLRFFFELLDCVLLFVETDGLEKGFEGVGVVDHSRGRQGAGAGARSHEAATQKSTKGTRNSSDEVLTNICCWTEATAAVNSGSFWFLKNAFRSGTTTLRTRKSQEARVPHSAPYFSARVQEVDVCGHCLNIELQVRQSPTRRRIRARTSMVVVVVWEKRSPESWPVSSRWLCEQYGKGESGGTWSMKKSGVVEGDIMVSSMLINESVFARHIGLASKGQRLL
ncbi:hypothetical protein BDK51DRAFT_29875 [Blyttiomyces helicus]|uniref:Uncharacterized protein n=1 Tax=Blyttiomyces helicus TaxID=388810 RepID=A0A4P9WET8_9FUNG|nr:hypothetical protein BDK51DRAFT_29875 [Blyttiomyces helicus]|eukprot:RKO88916.1 hypothetical protein BDK51DRAFT_29875 [Blyttiomyces helicus]